MLSLQNQIQPFALLVWGGGGTIKRVKTLAGIDVGGGWRIGCGSHTQSAERVEKLEESVWSVVRQENESEVQGKVTGR